MAAASPIAPSESLTEFLDREFGKQLLRFTTAGSVDDGKSTLIGRLLHDCKAVYEDQLASVKKSPVNRSGRAIDFSLLTDGLRAEREQGITIDVAYRYFSTPRRKFIIADTPGHEQYTRNMATGASTAQLAVILVDATKGLLPQTRRHTFIASLLGIRHLLVAVNKMDLASFSEEVFSKVHNDFSALASQLGHFSIQCIPLSALEGDNIVNRSAHTPWYTGPTMLEHLETVEIHAPAESAALRFPIQSVIRPDANFRGFAGRIASGTVRPGDEVLALPSLRRTRIDSIAAFDGDLLSASTSDSVVLTLADEIDLSRGDMLVAPQDAPAISAKFSAMVVWLHSTPLNLNRPYLAKHAGRTVKARATQILHRVDVNSLEKLPASRLEMNEIALVAFETSHPLFFDPYNQNRTTGSLILIDPLNNSTVGAVMIREDLSVATEQTPQTGPVSASERAQRHGHRPAIISLRASRPRIESLERTLWNHGFHVASVDSSTTPLATLQQLFNLGFIILLWRSQSQPDSVRPVLLSGVARDSHFDLLEFQSKHASDPEALSKEILRLANSLRTEPNSITNEAL